MQDIKDLFYCLIAYSVCVVVLILGVGGLTSLITGS